MKNYGNLATDPIISYQPKKLDMILQFHTWIKISAIIDLSNDDFFKGWMEKYFHGYHNTKWTPVNQ